MDEAGIDELRGKLKELEAEAAQLSAVRGRLHDQIDFGFASEGTRDREREISDERQKLHRRIDALRAQLQAQELV